MLALLDRFVRDVPWNEGDAEGAFGRSWHAKLALVRLVADDDSNVPAEWRFWLGSRNLTRDTSWDIGLSLETVPSGSSGGQSILGIEQAAARLSDHAGEASAWQPLIQELADIRWNVPRGLHVKRVVLMLPEDTDRGLPQCPRNVRLLLAVAPFLDGETVRRLGAWTDQTRTLRSTVTELGRLINQSGRPLDGFELLTLPGTPEENEAPPEEDAASLDASPDARGLHAKLLWAEHAGGATLWLGSPNLTTRAWGRNAEAFAEIGAQLRGGAKAAKSLYEGIKTFLQLARAVRREDLKDTMSEDSDQGALEVARRQVATRLCGHQRRGEGEVTIVQALDRPPHPNDPRISLIVGRIGGNMVPWPRDTISLAFPETDGSADTDLVSVRVMLRDQSLSWTQLVPFDPPLPMSRDTAILREYLGARGVLSWIRDVLDDAMETDGGGAWDDETERHLPGGPPRGTFAFDMPTVEQVLRAWVRDPDRLANVDRILNAVAIDTSQAEDDAEARAHLEAFSRSWQILRTELSG
ncbi:MAG: hypothetical protein OXQ31_04310 [Spirochaetaceae bacterium]|nr:hypothetical protein [Spirochaetaceae bacterium]